MKTKNQFYFFTIIGIILLFSYCSKSPNEDSSLSNEKSSQIGISENLTHEEIAGIMFMREEEKLARDVYIVLGSSFAHQTFNNISQSEQRHTDAILYLINFYELEDPAKKEIGEFTNADLQELYNFLIDLGSQNLDSALTVGAIIEETDILDIEELAHETEVENILQVYHNLLAGSENHLRAFVYALGIRGIAYSPRFLTQEEFDEIINDTES